MILMTARLRRAVLIVHVVTSVGLIGAVAAFLALAVVGLVGQDASVYPAARLLTLWLIVPLLAFSLALGAGEAAMTPWGLWRHHWVATKLWITAASLAVLVMQLNTIALLAGAAGAAPVGHDLAGGRLRVVLHAAGGLAVLVGLAVLSIMKPKGLTEFGERAEARRRTLTPNSAP